MNITGSIFVDRVKMLINYEANQLDGGERWEVIVKRGGTRTGSFTNNPSPWSLIEKLIAEALDSTPVTPQQKFDMNKRRRTDQTPVKRRRKHPKGSVPDSKFNIEAIERALKEASNG